MVLVMSLILHRIRLITHIVLVDTSIETDELIRKQYEGLIFEL